VYLNLVEDWFWVPVVVGSNPITLTGLWCRWYARLPEEHEVSVRSREGPQFSRIKVESNTYVIMSQVGKDKEEIEQIPVGDSLIPQRNSGSLELDVKKKLPVLKSRKSSWPEKLMSSSGEILKNWTSLIMGVAALVTAIGTYWKPIDESKTKGSWDLLRKELKEISVDVSNLNKDISRLYQARDSDVRKKKIIEELERTAYEIEDTQLREMLTKKYGKAWADKYMDTRRKHRDEIRQEWIKGIDRINKEKDKEERRIPEERALPEYGEEKK